MYGEKDFRKNPNGSGPANNAGAMGLSIGSVNFHGAVPMSYMFDDSRSFLTGLIEATKNKHEDTRFSPCAREIEKALTSLEEAKMWLGKCIQAIDEKQL